MKILLATIALLVMGMQPAEAGRFCVAGMGVAPMCVYDDANTCREAADPPNTSCIVNEETYLSQLGGENYCLVTAQGIAECYYRDRDQCDSEARRNGAVCKSNSQNDIKENPYRYDTRVQY